MQNHAITYYMATAAVIFMGILVPSHGYSAPRSFSDILKSNTLNICYTPWRGADTEPDMPSPHMEVARVFAKFLNLKPVVKAILWPEQFQDASGKTSIGQTYTPVLFDNGSCDLFANNLGKLPWRQKLMNFNWLYSDRNVVVVLKRNMEKFQIADDLSGKKTVVVPETAYHDWLLRYNSEHDQKIEINTVSAGGTLTYLLNGEADFIILSSPIVIYSKFHMNHEIEIAFPISQLDASGWGFPKNDSILLEQSKEFIEEQSGMNDSEINSIFKRYFGLSLNELHELQDQTIP